MFSILFIYWPFAISNFMDRSKSTTKSLTEFKVIMILPYLVMYALLRIVVPYLWIRAWFIYVKESHCCTLARSRWSQLSILHFEKNIISYLSIMPSSIPKNHYHGITKVVLLTLYQQNGIMFDLKLTLSCKKEILKTNLYTLFNIAHRM